MLTHSADPQLSPPVQVLGLPISTFTHRHILDRSTQYFEDDKTHHIVTANSLLALEAEKNPLLKKICNEASLVLADSSGMAWAARSLGSTEILRWPGIDFAFDLCGLAEILSKRVYLLGGEPGIAKKAAHFLNASFPYLIFGGMRDGYFKGRDEETIIHDIAESRSKLVLVALGSPRQELWIYQNRHLLPPAIYIGVGGSFNVWAGAVNRAPTWVRSLGFEWAYRLWQEPFRISRILKLPLFALKILNAKLRST